MMTKLDSTLTEYLVHKAPSLPANVKELIVKYAPYINIILILLVLPAILAFVGFSTALAPFGYWRAYRGAGYLFNISGILSLVGLALNLLASPGLFKRSMNQGWRYLFWATLVSAVSSLISFNLGSLIINTAISLYFLYQVKSYYK